MKRSVINLSTKLLDLWLPALITQERIPGLAIGITHKDKLVYKRAFGVANLEMGEKLKLDHVFRIASISKSITAVAVLQLQEQGKLRLDDPASQYVPWVKGTKKDHKDAAKITIRQLLANEGGLTREGRHAFWANDQFPARAQMKAKFSTGDLIQEHGMQFKYSNLGYALLGEVIRKTSGLSWDAYVTKRIVEPLKLTSTAPDYDKALNYAVGYERDKPGQERGVELNPPARAFAPSAGVSSTVEDLAQFVMALRLESNALLQRDSLKELQRPQSFTGAGSDMYGLGVDLYEVEDHGVLGHGGAYPGYSTEFLLDPTNEMGVVVMVNQTACPVQGIASGALQVLYQMQSEGHAAGKRIALSSAIDGLYTSRWGDTVVLGVKDGAVAFDPDTYSPMSSPIFLKASGKKALFMIDKSSNYHSIGETARFTIPKGTKKATKLTFGSTPSKRVS